MWFHFECCITVQTPECSFTSIHDYVMLPILKGGCLGGAGTVPLIYAAAEVLTSGQNSDNDPKTLIETKLSMTVEDILPAISGVARALINSCITCPTCYCTSQM